VTATPRYPIQAIREAKQGRVVTCFSSMRLGSLSSRRSFELSDEIFRERSRGAEPLAVRPRESDTFATELPQLHVQLDRLAQSEIEIE